MAEGKKGFVLYADYQELFEELDNDNAGQLIKHIFKYVNDEDPDTSNPMVKLAFIPIKRQLKRDLVKYEKSRQQRIEAGIASGKARSTKSTTVNDRSTKRTVIGKGNVTGKVIVKGKVIKEESTPPDFEEFKSYALEKDYSIDSTDLKLKYEAWIENGWKDGHDKVIKNWKSKLLQTIPYLKKINGKDNNRNGKKHLTGNEDFFEGA